METLFEPDQVTTPILGLKNCLKGGVAKCRLCQCYKSTMWRWEGYIVVTCHRVSELIRKLKQRWWRPQRKHLYENELVFFQNPCVYSNSFNLSNTGAFSWPQLLKRQCNWLQNTHWIVFYPVDSAIHLLKNWELGKRERNVYFLLSVFTCSCRDGKLMY